MLNEAIMQQNQILANYENELFNLISARRTKRVIAEIEMVREKVWRAEGELSNLQERRLNDQILNRAA